EGLPPVDTAPQAALDTGPVLGAIEIEGLRRVEVHAEVEAVDAAGFFRPGGEVAGHVEAPAPEMGHLSGDGEQLGVAFKVRLGIPQALVDGFEPLAVAQHAHPEGRA